MIHNNLYRRAKVLFQTLTFSSNYTKATIDAYPTFAVLHQIAQRYKARL